jgi:hypothetical protein
VRERSREHDFGECAEQRVGAVGVGLGAGADFVATRVLRLQVLVQLRLRTPVVGVRALTRSANKATSINMDLPTSILNIFAVSTCFKTFEIYFFAPNLLFNPPQVRINNTKKV